MTWAMSPATTIAGQSMASATATSGASARMGNASTA